MSNAVIDFVSEWADDRIERNPEDYEIGWSDYGYFNNGVGWACCGGETEYDEEQAYNDSVDEIIEHIENENFPEIWDLLQLPEIMNELKKCPNYDEDLDFLYGDKERNKKLVTLFESFIYSNVTFEGGL